MPSCCDYNSSMIRTQIQLTEEQIRKVRRAAREQGVSLAEIIRRCVERGIDAEVPDRGALYARAGRSVGAFRDRDDAGDVSTRHDAYLDQAFE